MKIVVTTIIILLVQACATSTKLKDSGDFITDKNVEESINLVLSQGNKCWAKTYNIFQDEIKVWKQGNQVLVRRWAPDLGYEHTQPRFIASFSEKGTATKVSFSEGDCGFLCFNTNHTKDVERWLSGDLTCKVNSK